MNAMSQRLAELVCSASDGAITASDALEDSASLIALGLGSLGFLRLVDAVEQEYGVELDLGEGFGALDRVTLIVERLRCLGVSATADTPR